MSLLDQQPDSVAIAARTSLPAASTLFIANANVFHAFTTFLAVVSGILTVWYLIVQIRQARERSARERRQEEREIRRASVQEARDARADQLREMRSELRALKGDVS